MLMLLLAVNDGEISNQDHNGAATDGNATDNNIGYDNNCNNNGKWDDNNDENKDAIIYNDRSSKNYDKR